MDANGKRRLKMKGRIFLMGKRAKIEIWREVWAIETNRDNGGYCEICNRGFVSVRDLIKHFINVHKEGGR